MKNFPVATKTSLALQGSEEWLAVRRGRITGSRAKDSTDRLKSGGFGAKAALYAKDVARERCGGTVWRGYVSSPMKTGTTEEEMARIAYEVRTGYLVDEVGFVYSTDGWWGCSPDGLVDLPGERGGIEIKTMVGSENLFSAMVHGDIDEFIAQVYFEIQLAQLDWIDVILWAPDFEGASRMRIVRVHRDDEAIKSLFGRLEEFKALVEQNEFDLRNYLGTVEVREPADVSDIPGEPASSDLPESLF
jgi:hypothetical protein